MIKILFSDQDHVNENISLVNSIFLAGPSPRGDKDPEINWRLTAIELYKEMVETFNIKDITLCIPLPLSGVVADYDHQIEWEQKYLKESKLILFWVPRDLAKLPAFTTNVEFGQYITSDKIIYGRPDSAPKNRYLDKLFAMNQPNNKIYNTLEDTVKASLLKQN